MQGNLKKKIMPHLLSVMLKVTRSGESERRGGEREMEESEVERKEDKAAVDIRSLKFSIDGQSVVTF